MLKENVHLSVQELFASDFDFLSSRFINTERMTEGNSSQLSPLLAFWFLLYTKPTLPDSVTCWLQIGWLFSCWEDWQWGDSGAASSSSGISENRDSGSKVLTCFISSAAISPRHSGEAASFWRNKMPSDFQWYGVVVPWQECQQPGIAHVVSAPHADRLGWALPDMWGWQNTHAYRCSVHTSPIPPDLAKRKGTYRVLPLDSDVLQISVGVMHVHPWTEASKAAVGFCQPLSDSWLSPVEVSRVLYTHIPWQGCALVSWWSLSGFAD